MTKTKTPRKRTKRKPEAARLTSLLNEAAAHPKTAPSPEVLVPPQRRDWVGETVAQIRKVASTPRRELLGQAEKAVVYQARRLLKANAQYGLSVSGLVRSGAMFLFSIPGRRSGTGSDPL